MAQQQGSLNSQTSQLIPRPGSQLDQQGREQARQLGRQQREVAASLDEMSDADRTGRAEELAKEARQLAQALESGALDPNVIDRQQRLFRRMLDADRLEAGDPLAWRRDEVPPRVLQRLRRGQYAAQDELDLHHEDAARAEALLRTFVKESVQAGLGCVRVVHGKGLHSDTGVPVLKNLVDRMLRQRGDVLAYHSAPPAQGGLGAVLVLLRRR